MSSDSGRDVKPPLGWKGRLLLVGFGLVLVLGLELALRLFGFGGQEPLLVPFLPAHQDRPALWEVNPQLGRNFFPRRDASGERLLASHRRELVALPKPEGTLRIVFAGASSVEGFPMPRNLTAARFLESWLREALPGRKVEVLNLGMAAVATYPVREIALRALEESDPDILLLYAGHNEFFGATGVASSQLAGRSVGAVEAAMRLRGLALTQALDRAVSGAVSDVGGEGDEGSSAGGGNLIEVMAAIDDIEPEGPLHRAARSNAIENLARVVRAARGRGVPVVVGTLVSNERGMAPMASWVDQEPPPSELASALFEAEALLAQDPTSALAHYQEVLSLHPRHAGAVWGTARALEELGRESEAVEQYRRARDLDAMPWRAPRALNEAIRRMVEEEGAILAPVEARFAERSGGANDWALFVDHVHPSLEGQALLASSFLDTLRAYELIEGIPLELSSWQERALDLGSHPLERYLLVHKMATLFSMPPIGLNNEATAQRLQRLLTQMETSGEPVDREAIRRWKEHSARAGFALPISLIAARVALEGQDLARLAIYARSAIFNAFPYSDERCAAGVLARLGAVATEGRYDGAPLDDFVDECETVATLPGQPSALLARSLGSLLHLAGETQRGRDMESVVEELLVDAPPWMQSYVEMVPDLTVFDLGTPVPAERSLGTGVGAP